MRIHPMPDRYRFSGFTLTELLAVIAILGVLVSLVLAGIGLARDSARASRCLSNMRQIGVAMRLYAGEHRGNLAPAPRPWGGGQDNFWYRDWMYSYAPYIKDDFDKSRDWNMEVFWCPSFIPTSSKPGPQGPPAVANWQIQSTSYWLGDFASGVVVASGEPLAPRNINLSEDLSRRHLLREEGFYHSRESRMNLLYGDGRVQSYSKNSTSFPPP